VRRWLLLAITAVALVVLWPRLVDVYSVAGNARHLAAGWLVAIVVLVALQMVANWQMLRIVLRTTKWFEIAAPQLAGNAASHLLPGGNAFGAGLQLRMLSTAGFPATQVVPALGAVSVLGTLAGFVVLPLVVLVASAAGSHIDADLVIAMWVGAGGLLALLAFVVVAARSEWPWQRAALMVAWVQRRVRRPSDALALQQRLLHERDLIVEALRERAVLVAVIALARPSFDYLTLLFSLLAVGAHVNPAAVLAAFIVSNIAGMIPLTPGGLGFVEASLAGVLTVAGASDLHANLAVATYRVGETWLPCIAGAIAFLMFQRVTRSAP
jgi:uncharacterized protein (TIRG00374 family)